LDILIGLGSFPNIDVIAITTVLMITRTDQ